jgi:hypothetical protein
MRQGAEALERDKKMTTSTVPTATKDMANTSLVSDFKASLLPVLQKEKALWVEMVGLMANDSLSVRGGKATIEAVNNETGSLPTIAVSAVQYFPSAGFIYHNVLGSKDATLSTLLNVTIQGTRKLGAKRFKELVEVSNDFKKLAKVVADAPAKEKAEGKAKPEGVDALIVALAEALEADSFEGIVRDPELAEAVAKQLGACAKHSKAINHPAGKALQATA